MDERHVGNIHYFNRESIGMSENKVKLQKNAHNGIIVHTIKKNIYIPICGIE